MNIKMLIRIFFIFIILFYLTLFSIVYLDVDIVVLAKEFLEANMGYLISLNIFALTFYIYSFRDQNIILILGSIISFSFIFIKDLSTFKQIILFIK
jgi:hypothetical protein